MVNQSGTFDQPTMLPLPPALQFDEFDLKDMFCYVLEHPGKVGIACIICRDVKNDLISIQMGDWEGNVIDLSDKKCPLADIASKFLYLHHQKFTELMKNAGIPQCMFYISYGADMVFKLVDMRISANKFAGPGMC